MNKLAIIIPAYKGGFFEKTMQSLAEQTCKDFTVYIGIDASPYDFETVINKYKTRLDLHVTRFSNNLGGKDLVAQWERCISLSKGEEWLWLFSDDDYLSNDCVNSVLQMIEHCQKSDLLHLNVSVVDETNTPVNARFFKKEPFPSIMSAADYIRKRLTFKLNSFVVEYIFSREVYNKYGGFTNIDLAWGSDDATWAKFSQKGKIITIPTGTVFWRCSDLNISPDNKPEVIKRKIYASLTYIAQLKDIFGYTIEKESRYFILRRLANYSGALTASHIKNVLSEFKVLYSLPFPSLFLQFVFFILGISKKYLK